MLIFASEDIGNADPQAHSQVAVAAAEAFDRVGLPEGRLILAQAATYLASAPEEQRQLCARSTRPVARRAASTARSPVPLHLRNAPTELMAREGYGKGYRYPHQEEGHFVRAQYLPDRLARATFYRPADQGHEEEIGSRLRAWWGDTKDEPTPDDAPVSRSKFSERGED